MINTISSILSEVELPKVLHDSVEKKEFAEKHEFGDDGGDGGDGDGGDDDDDDDDCDSDCSYCVLLNTTSFKTTDTLRSVGIFKYQRYVRTGQQ